MNAVGEDDLTYPALRDSLKQARVQAKLRPVEDRIKATTSFIERAKRTIGKHQASQIGRRTSASAFPRWRRTFVQVVSRSQPDGRRHSAHSSFGFHSQVRTVEIFRARVAERERDELRAQFHSNACSEERERSIFQHSGVGSVESRGSRANEIPGQVQRGAGGDSSALMESLIDNAESNLCCVNRLNPLLTT